MSKSNEGITGAASIRLGGRKVDELPIAESALTKEQLPAFLKSDKQNKIDSIKARYPTQSIAWVDGAMRECNQNLQNVRDLKNRTQSSIDEYMGLKRLCVKRDELLMPLQEGKDDDKIKEIKGIFPPYVTKAMKQQIGQFKATINRCDDVVDKEHSSIAELKMLRSKCEERDKLLKELGPAA